MSFYDEFLKYDIDEVNRAIDSVTEGDIERALSKDNLSPMDFLALLSKGAESYLESMAQKASGISTRHFGRAINLYTPLYISNYCVNNCVYCGFSSKNSIQRCKLSLEEVESRARSIASKGFQHLLLLTGESRIHSPLSYIGEVVTILKKYFSSIGIETYPLETEEYAYLIDLGVDSLTIYQETYDMKLYQDVHVSGPKSDFLYRLSTPERGARAGMYSVGIGALLGLGDWRIDAFFTGLHGSYLEKHFPEVSLGVSMPRLRPEVGGFSPTSIVSDTSLVQFMLATRLFLNRALITLSTRESESLRNNMLALGVNKLSAESDTSIDGTDDSSQFEIADHRSLDEMTLYLRQNGYQPVLKDWTRLRGY